VDSTRAIKLLLERRLITIAGKDGATGKKMVFKTTEKFLELYGLRSIDDLPTYKDIESLELEPSTQSMANSLLQRVENTESKPEKEPEDESTTEGSLPQTETIRVTDQET